MHLHSKVSMINVLHVFLNIQINAMILLNMTKPPVGGGKCLFY